MSFKLGSSLSFAIFLTQTLETIASKVPANQVWLFNEEDRLSYAAARVLERGLLSSEVVSQCLEVLTLQQSSDLQLNAIPRHNAKIFLQSLYFQVLKLEPSSQHLELILAALRKFN